MSQVNTCQYSFWIGRFSYSVVDVDVVVVFTVDTVVVATAAAACQLARWKIAHMAHKLCKAKQTLPNRQAIEWPLTLLLIAFLCCCCCGCGFCCCCLVGICHRASFLRSGIETYKESIWFMWDRNIENMYTTISLKMKNTIKRATATMWCFMSLLEQACKLYLLNMMVICYFFSLALLNPLFILSEHENEASACRPALHVHLSVWCGVAIPLHQRHYLMDSHQRNE